MAHPNVELLEVAAARLRPLLSEIVFVGGCVTGLLINEAGAAPARTTIDVDVIAEIASVADYAVFSERIRTIGFNEDMREDAPVCRWRHSELILDVIPLDPTILGFSNSWYPEALHSSNAVELPSGSSIRVITAPYFLATKIEAFRGRGREDYFASHDPEDIVAVVDGRDTLQEELAAAPEGLRLFVATAIVNLMANPRFLDALPGYLLPDEANQARIRSLTARLRSLSELS